MTREAYVGIVVALKFILAIVLTVFGTWLGGQMFAHPLGRTAAETGIIKCLGLVVIASCIALGIEMVAEARRDWRDR